MKMSSALRATLFALAAFAAAIFSSASHADEGFVTLTIYKAGWIIGGSGGGGTLTFRGRTYPLSTGGLDYGLVFGGSKTVLRGTVSNINRPSDVAGVYGAAGAGLAVGSGARAIVLTNQKGAVLELAGRQTGLMANADLSGLAITLKWGSCVGWAKARMRRAHHPTLRSQTVGTLRFAHPTASAAPRRHCERSEAIHASTRGQMDCFVAFALRN